MVWAHPQEGAVKGNFSPDLLDQIKRKINDKVELSLQVNRHLNRIVDASGRSLLHYAAEFGNDYIAQLLIDTRAQANLQDHDGNTPLLLATRRQHATTIRVLLECSNTDVYICNKTGASAVQIALRTSPIDVKIAKLFLQRIGNDCSSDSTEIIEALMKIKCPIYVAVLLENVNVTTGMLSEGCSIEAKDPTSGKTALHFAAENVDLAHVQNLLFFGADVMVKDAGGKPALAQLSDFRKSAEALGIVKILLNKTRLTSRDNCGFMHMRSILRNGSADAVSTALQSLRSFTAMDRHDQGIMHYLAGNCSPGIAEVAERFRVFEKLDLNARDEFGLTALHCAMTVGNVQFVERLVGQGVNLHVLDHDGVSPLMQAVQPMMRTRLEQRVECVKLLLRSNAQPDIFVGHYFKAHDSESAIDRDYPLIEPAIALLAAWEAVERPFNRGILKKINSYARLRRLFEVCTIELERMRAEKVAFWNVTVLDMLAEYDDDKYSRYSLFFIFSGPWTKRAIRKYQSIPIYYEVLYERVCKVISTKEANLEASTCKFIKICFIIFGIISVVLLVIPWLGIVYMMFAERSHRSFQTSHATQDDKPISRQ